jgi:hypothetical protein
MMTGNAYQDMAFVALLAMIALLLLIVLYGVLQEIDRRRG